MFAFYIIALLSFSWLMWRLMEVPKPIRYQNEKYLEFIRKMPCTVCAGPASDAHHVETRGAGGSDLTAIPLCRKHHSEIHAIGVATAAERWGIDFNNEQELLKKFFQKRGGVL